MLDKVATTDEITTELAELVQPNNPCYSCGKETVEYTYEVDPVTQRPGAVLSRICSSDSCRKIQ
jgi:hypothetical protein